VSQHPPKARSYEVRRLGAQHLYSRDAYHAFLRVTCGALAGIVLFYLALNALFALAYMLSEGGCSMKRGDHSSGKPPQEAGATPMRVNLADLRKFPGRSGVPTEITYPAEPGRSVS
jgi:hypothetical protein